MTTKKKSVGCNCLKETNKLLESRNAKIVTHMMWSKSGMSISEPSVRLEKCDSKIRKPLPVLFCTHCPFCGKKY